ncbi:uncharacterized protein LOC108629905 [Ceratina calcarata]|uniref:Uncharacterized protein LOC108629905 n=1 Tax=Ceratina calcarata TaxID=156304 RepID=A0AAJ7J9Y1_9HYME|nr:uncharacterized protein LOC108629905 [Ceratina calcarata]
MDWLIEPKRNDQVWANDENPVTKTVHELKLEKKCARLTRENKQLRKQLKDVKQKPVRVKKYGIHFRNKSRNQKTIDEFLDKQGCKNEVAKALVKLQLKGENAHYTSEERDLAKMIFYNSASTYSKLRKSGCHLPAESTVRRWISVYNLETGFSDDVFHKTSFTGTTSPGKIMRPEMG